MYANVNGVSAMRGLALVLALCALGAAAGGRSLLSAPAAFELESTLQLNDAARADREVGYKLRARLDVAPRAAADHDLLLQFRLHSPKLYLRGKHVNADFMAYDSVWDSYSDSTFYAHWSSGELKAAYLDPGELPDVLNYKKSLLSLFQIQMHDGEYNETDVSGPCRVLYETISTDVFRKIKVACEGDAGGAVSSARRVQRYTLAGGQLAALHAEELLLLGPAALGLKARSWHTLRRADPAPSAPPLSALPAALQALPAALQPATLALQPAPGDHDDHEELGAALAAGAAALAGEAARAGGGADAAAAMLELLPALRRANHSAAAQLLQRADMHDHLTGLCRLLGLAGTAGAHAAADDFLQLRAREPLVALAHTYLDALALAPEPDDSVLLDLLRLADDAREPSVRAHALLAAAAAARAHPAAAARARDALARGLARCRDAECRALRLRALGNLRSADTVDVLLQHAERAERPVALAALLALDDAPSHALTFARLDRLQALALRGTAALEVRGAALDLLVRRRAAVPTPLAQVAHELHARGPHELRRVLWQRVEALAPAHEELAALPARLGPALRGWDAAAHGGTSSVLVRAPGWALGGWRAELQSLQLASAGLLRRGEVRLLAYDEHGDSYDALTVDVGTRGLEVFGGSSGDDNADQPQQLSDTSESPASSEPSESSEPAESTEPAGTLALSVGGARLPDIPLFNGQAELLGHVWAGTASEPTPVLRALRPLLDTRSTVPLLGGVRAHVGVRAALALALDAQAQVSLWWRSARAGLALRAGLAGAATARVHTAWSSLSARADVRVAPRLRIGADLDFYSNIALCVRVAAAPHDTTRTVTLHSRGGARQLQVRRVRTQSTRRPGRTLALGRRNDATCRTLRAHDADGDADDDVDADANEGADAN